MATTSELGQTSDHSQLCPVFRLLDLPKELRLIVYENLPVTSQEHEIWFEDGRKFDIVTEGTPVALLATCRLVREESYPFVKAKVNQVLTTAPRLIIGTKSMFSKTSTLLELLGLVGRDYLPLPTAFRSTTRRDLYAIERFIHQIQSCNLSAFWEGKPCLSIEIMIDADFVVRPDTGLRVLSLKNLLNCLRAVCHRRQMRVMISFVIPSFHGQAKLIQYVFYQHSIQKSSPLLSYDFGMTEEDMHEGRRQYEELKQWMISL